MYGTNLQFVQTCGACPEQYDVFAPGDNIENESNRIGYVRYRYGYLSADYYPPEKRYCDGDCSESVFGERIGGEMDGILSPEDREHYLTEISTLLAEKYFQSKICSVRHDIWHKVFGDSRSGE